MSDDYIDDFFSDVIPDETVQTSKSRMPVKAPQPPPGTAPKSVFLQMPQSHRNIESSSSQSTPAVAAAPKQKLSLAEQLALKRQGQQAPSVAPSVSQSGVPAQPRISSTSNKFVPPIAAPPAPAPHASSALGSSVFSSEPRYRRPAPPSSGATAPSPAPPSSTVAKPVASVDVPRQPVSTPFGIPKMQQQQQQLQQQQQQLQQQQSRPAASPAPAVATKPQSPPPASATPSPAAASAPVPAPVAALPAASASASVSTAPSPTNTDAPDAGPAPAPSPSSPAAPAAAPASASPSPQAAEQEPKPVSVVPVSTAPSPAALVPMSSDQYLRRDRLLGHIRPRLRAETLSFCALPALGAQTRAQARLRQGEVAHRAVQAGHTADAGVGTEAVGSREVGTGWVHGRADVEIGQVKKSGGDEYDFSHIYGQECEPASAPAPASTAPASEASARLSAFLLRGGALVARILAQGPAAPALGRALPLPLPDKTHLPSVGVLASRVTVIPAPAPDGALAAAGAPATRRVSSVAIGGGVIAVAWAPVASASPGPSASLVTLHGPALPAPAALAVSGAVTTVAVAGRGAGLVVVAGLDDGSVCAWAEGAGVVGDLEADASVETSTDANANASAAAAPRARLRVRWPSSLHRAHAAAVRGVRCATPAARATKVCSVGEDGAARVWSVRGAALVLEEAEQAEGGDGGGVGAAGSSHSSCVDVHTPAPTEAASASASTSTPLFLVASATAGVGVVPGAALEARRTMPLRMPYHGVMPVSVTPSSVADTGVPFDGAMSGSLQVTAVGSLSDGHIAVGTADGTIAVIDIHGAIHTMMPLACDAPVAAVLTLPGQPKRWVVVDAVHRLYLCDIAAAKDRPVLRVDLVVDPATAQAKGSAARTLPCSSVFAVGELEGTVSIAVGRGDAVHIYALRDRFVATKSS